ncbi:hypothetical protein GCM10019071_11040 [Sphingobium fuliginis]|uniref:Uncharacterized protein n=1 Tax=Sphingobium fuliginis (strain ATCC 27551) TaxID=336203 RepID=A0ABQ1ERM6_SPHSA|nr:hypothetical protein GCM10019071_11040 [Sphingobium fuliginis]
MTPSYDTSGRFPPDAAIQRPPENGCTWSQAAQAEYAREAPVKVEKHARESRLPFTFGNRTYIN